MNTGIGTMPRLVIFVNGSLQDPAAAQRLITSDNTLIAADGGTRHIRALGLVPSVILGDMDSLNTGDRDWAQNNSVKLVKYPRDKDETDLELALKYAVDQGFRNVLILAALGDRLDQTLGNLALLTGPHLVSLDIRLSDGLEEVWFVRGSTQVHGQTGDIVSLLSWGDVVTGVTTEGLRWPLKGESLLPHKTRGISNELLTESATVSISSGLLLVIHRRRTTGK
jgi:thiamine pyrophosphokinase